MKKHLFKGITAAILILGSPGLSSATNLIITGVIDGPLAGGTPKAVELFTAGHISDLSEYGLGFANNGGGSDFIEFAFPATPVAPGSFIYVASEPDNFIAFFDFAPDYTTTAANINGDDAVELYHNAMVIDLFGNISLDGSGQPWEYLDGWAYRNRYSTVSTYPEFSLEEWHFSGPNVLDGELINRTAAFPFPAGSFTGGNKSHAYPTPEPSTCILLGSGLACLAARRKDRKSQ